MQWNRYFQDEALPPNAKHKVGSLHFSKADTTHNLQTLYLLQPAMHK